MEMDKWNRGKVGEKGRTNRKKKGKKQMLRNQKKKKTTIRMTKNKYRDYKIKEKAVEWKRQKRNKTEIKKKYL